MIPQFTINLSRLRRVLCVALAALLFCGTLPLLGNKTVAADQYSHRSIQLSDSSPSGGTVTTGIGSGTNVTYQVTFTNTHQSGSMVIDFCSQDPIIGDACARPTGMSAPSAIALSPQAATNAPSATIGGTGWTLDTSSAGQVKIKDDGASAHDAQANTEQMFDVTFATNPSTTGTFYARMYSYCDNSYGSTGTCPNGGTPTTNFTGAYSNPTNPGGFVDYGGIALSTVALITITARVQESLTFCVSKAAPGVWNSSPATAHDCSDPEVTTDATNGSHLPAIVLGHSTGSGVPVLDNNHVDTGDIYSQLSTNATYGAVINLHNSNTTCGGLSADNGATCAIPPINGGNVASGPSHMVSGTAAFGMIVFPGVADVAGSGIGSDTPASGYYSAANDTEDSNLTVTDTAQPTGLTSATEAADYFGMEYSNTNPVTANGGNYRSFGGGVSSTYGSTLATTSGPVYHVDNHYVFGATASLTTPAGIYTANLSMIATGTF